MTSLPPTRLAFSCSFCGDKSGYSLVGTLHGHPRTTGPLREVELLPRGYECERCGSENHVLHTRGEWRVIDGFRRAG